MVLEKLADIIAEQFGVGANSITADTSFQEDLNADSLDLVDLIMALEEEFEISVEDEEIESFKTIGDVENFIKDKI